MKDRQCHKTCKRAMHRLLSLAMAGMMMFTLPAGSLYAEEIVEALPEADVDAAADVIASLPEDAAADIPENPFVDETLPAVEDMPEDMAAELIDIEISPEADETWAEELWEEDELIFSDEEDVILEEDLAEPADEELYEESEAQTEDWLLDAPAEDLTEEAQELGAPATSGTCGDYIWDITDGNTLNIRKTSSTPETGAVMTPIPTSDIQGYANIKKIVVHNSIYQIGNSMFKGFSNIQEAVLYMADNIGEEAFSGCTSLKKVSFNIGGAIYIHDKAFLNCSALDTLTFSDSSSKLDIGAEAFSGCTTLTSSDIKFENVKTIGNQAFYGCTGIENVIGATNLTSLGWRAFYGCTNLVTFETGSSLTEIGPQAFMGCSKLKYISGWDNVTNIHLGAFVNCKALASVTLPTHLKTLGTLAFAQCTNLTSVTMGSEITTVEDGAFSGCTALPSINLSESITILGSVQHYMGTNGYEGTVTEWDHREKNGVFSNCDALKKVVVPSKVTAIGGHMFFDSGVEEVVLPNGVTSIGTRVFEGSALKKINWPGGVPEISTNAFKYCSNLSEVTIGEGVTVIGPQAFNNCAKLKTVKFPSTLTKIQNSAFDECPMLEEADLGKTKITEIPERCFYGCTALKKVTLPATVTGIGFRAFNLSGITALSAPQSVAKVQSLAFDSCPELASLDLQYVKEFEVNAVSNCPKLAKLDISNRITTVTDASFVTNMPEKTVTFHGKKSEFEAITNLAKNMDLLSGKIVYTDPEESEKPVVVKSEVDKLEDTILATKTYTDLPQSSFAPLKATASKVKKTSITISWKKVKTAQRYIVYGALRKKAYEKLGEVAAPTLKYVHKSLKQNKYYKYLVVAVSGTGETAKVEAVSKIVLAATKGGSFRNASSVKSNTKKKISLTEGKKLRLKPEIISKKSLGRRLMTFRKISFESSNTKVATVTKTGRIKAVGEGSCYIYMYAQNGSYYSVKVKVSAE